MNRLQTAYNHTKHSERDTGNSEIPRLCMEQWLNTQNTRQEPCFTDTGVFSNHCHNKCPLDRPTIFDEVLEKLCHASKL